MPSEILKKYSFHLFYFGLLLLVTGLPLSKFLMSVSQIILGAAWLMQGDYKKRVFSFFKNTPAVLFASIFFLHLAGLIYTSDMKYGLEDVRKKIPLFILPFMLSTMPPLSRKDFHNVLLVFVASVTLSTLISLSIYTGIYERPFNDIREISIFISHIRLSLLICLSIVILFYFFLQSPSAGFRFLFSAVMIWLLAFMVLLESFTGLVILSVLFFIAVVYQIIKSQERQMKIAFSLILLAFVSVSLFFLRQVYLDFLPKESHSPESVDKRTLQGNEYAHDFSSRRLENGYYLRHYVCMKELEEEWKKRSSLDFYSKDGKDQILQETLQRFLTSKGLRKDAEGVKKLSNAEIKAIENGVANIHYITRPGFYTRIHRLIWELQTYLSTHDPSGHSLTMRFEFWKAAREIIRDHPLFGVGTGDVKVAFSEQYEKMSSPLNRKYRLRAHNQYLSFAVALGIPLLVYFLFTLLYPLFQHKNDYLYTSFAVIALLSFLTEDTLETQAGATFYAFFNAFFLFCYKKH